MAATKTDETDLLVEAIWKRVEENVSLNAGTDSVISAAWDLVRALAQEEPARKARIVAVAVDLLESLPRQGTGSFRDQLIRRTSWRP